jgi:hypothetical protein
MLVLGRHVQLRTIANIKWNCWSHNYCMTSMQTFLLTLYFAVQFLKEFLRIGKLEPVVVVCRRLLFQGTCLRMGGTGDSCVT